MNKLSKLLVLAVALGSFIVTQPDAFAQPGSGGWANMDPQEMQKQMQARMMDSFRDQLSVTNDAEWQVIETRLSKVMRVRMETMMGGMGMGMFRRGGGPDGGGAAGRGFPGFGQPNPEAEALQKAIDGNVPSEQLKRALAQFRESRKLKQAQLEKAQAELRQVLSLKQEAVMVAAGMLD
jgi:hypothetical protein